MSKKIILTNKNTGKRTILTPKEYNCICGEESVSKVLSELFINNLCYNLEDSWSISFLIINKRK